MTSHTFKRRSDWHGFADGEAEMTDELTLAQWKSLAQSAENDCQRAIDKAQKLELDLKCLQESMVDRKAYEQMEARALEAERQARREAYEKAASVAGRYTVDPDDKNVHPDIAFKDMSENAQTISHMTAQGIAAAIRDLAEAEDHE